MQHNDILEATTDAAVAAAASKTTWGGAAVALYGWVSSSEGAAVTGLLIALVGLAVNTWFRWRDFRSTREVEAQRESRDRELHALRVARLRSGMPEVTEADE